MQLGFVNVFIVPIGLIWFNTLNAMYLRRTVRDLVDLKECSEWAADGSDFSAFEKT